MPSDGAFEERIGTMLRGKWRLERLLGSGGVAAVFLGRHTIGHYDAIKILHPRFAENAAMRARFEREARAVNQFRHPGAVAIRDIDVAEDGAPFLVMEYLEGESLLQRDRRERLSLEDVLRYTDELLDVLAAAHAHGIVHRDIKPANLFVMQDSSIKVLDFGIARVRQDVGKSMLTQEGDMLGTVAYMPPEQVRGGDIDHRADIFAVGATMFRILARRPIHKGKGEAMRMIKMATQPAPPLATVAPHVPDNVCEVVDRALAFDRNERYPTAATMQEDVRALRDGREGPYASAQPSPPRRTFGRDELPSIPGVDDSSYSVDTQDDPEGRPRSEEPTRSGGAADAPDRVGEELAGRFRLDALIGRGGMGAVYRATRLEDGSQVAVKLLERGLDSGHDGERFRREARASASIDSPHVVAVQEADVEPDVGVPYLVMDLLAGADLEHHLKATRPLTDGVVAAIFQQACRGVAAAHARNIVHRDIKPANIFLARDGGDIIVKLLDFGLAKQRHSDTNQSAHSLTQSGGVLGTPRYASPEQATNAKRVDVRTDVWGLCLSMYEALSGKQPWGDCETVGELIVAIVTTDLPPLREVAPWVGEGLAAVVDKGLEREPAQRWESVEALAAALAGFAQPLDEASLALRAEAVVVATPPRSASSRGTGDLSVPAFTTSPTPPRGRRTLVAVAALAAVAVGAVVAFTTMSQSEVAADEAAGAPGTFESAPAAAADVPADGTDAPPGNDAADDAARAGSDDGATAPAAGTAAEPVEPSVPPQPVATPRPGAGPIANAQPAPRPVTQPQPAPQPATPPGPKPGPKPGANPQPPPPPPPTEIEFKNEW